MRYPRFLVVLAFVALVGAACGGGGDGGDSGNGGGGTTTDSVTMVDNAFEPAGPVVSAGSALNLVNEGEAAHTFTLEEGGIDEQLAAGEETSVEISLDPGEYGFACSFHPEMTGTLTVQ